MLFSRQNVAFAQRDEAAISNVKRGGYVLSDAPGAKAAILASLAFHTRVRAGDVYRDELPEDPFNGADAEARIVRIPAEGLPYSPAI